MIRIIAVGKIKDKRLAALVDDYLKRIRAMAPVEVAGDPRRHSREGGPGHGRPAGSARGQHWWWPWTSWARI